MLVFISWSGQRSKAVAEALEIWLAQVIQAVEPWISQDIDKGLRWGTEIASRLELSKVGIICLTKSNLDARWIHFEAGALSKTRDTHVCTLLLDIKPSDVEYPLAQFQHTTTNKEDIFQLLSTINREVQNSGEKALAEPILTGIFETFWPRLEEVFQKINTLQESEASPSRSTGEMLEEMLEILRNQERRRISDADFPGWLYKEDRVGSRMGGQAVIIRDQKVVIELRLLRSYIKDIETKLKQATTAQEYVEVSELITNTKEKLYELLNYILRHGLMDVETKAILTDMEAQLILDDKECEIEKEYLASKQQ